MASMQGGRCISEPFQIIDLNEQLVLSTSNFNHSTACWSNLLNPGRQDTAGKRKTPEDGHTQLYSGGGSRSHLQAEDYMQHTVPVGQNASGSITTAPSPMEWSFTSQQEQLNLSIGIGKREAYSGGSYAQMYASGSSSTRLPAGNIVQHTILTSQDVSESITTVASPMKWSLTSQPEQLSVRIGIEERETYSEFFPPPNITDMAVFAAENIGERLDFGQQEPNLFDLALTDTALRPSGSSSANHPSRSLWSTDSSLICNPSSRPHEYLVPENTGSMIPSYMSGPLDSQSGRPLKSLRFSGGRATAFGDALNSRNILLQDSPALNSAYGNTRPSESLQSSSRSGSNLRMQNIPTGGTPPPNWTVPNQQGLTQFPLQSLLPNYGNQRGHFPVIPPTPSSLTESSIPPCSSQGRQNQSLRSALLIGGLPGPTSRQRGLAGETRNRQARQVRNTVQRGDNRRAQNVAAEVAEHDRHRDMRLDIDNMSYEELLALEERIGNVCTGLSEEVIMRCMKRRKHLSVSLTSPSEPCSICQEEFVAGDEIGATVCKHEFHFKCIKQWLFQKNVCPICKKTALNT